MTSSQLLLKSLDKNHKMDFSKVGKTPRS